MAKQTTLMGICITCICVLQLYSCIKPPEHFNPQDANNVYNGCRVKQITNLRTVESPLVTWNFTYNSNNDPVSVTSNAEGTGNPHLIFKYDAQCRLIEYSGIYTNGQFEFVHRYTHSGNRIVIDTQYVFGTYATLSGYFSKRYQFLTYDNFNRVSVDSQVYVFPTPQTFVTHYTYDAAGNLVNGKVYDSKLNPHRTNKIWMFVDRDYSVNNSVTATAYNTSMLPLSFSAPGSGFNLVFGYFYYNGTTNITYECK